MRLRRPTRWEVVGILLGSPILVAGVMVALLRMTYTGEASKLESRLIAARAEGLGVEPKDLRTGKQLAPSENAASLYRSAVAELRASRSSGFGSRESLIAFLDGRATAKDRALVVKNVSAASPALDRFEAASEKKAVNWGYRWEDAWNLRFPEMASMHTAIRLLCGRALLRFEAGDTTGAFRTLNATLRMARQVGIGSCLIGANIQVGCENALFKTVRAMLQIHSGREDLVRARKFLMAAEMEPDWRSAFAENLVLFRLDCTTDGLTRAAEASDLKIDNFRTRFLLHDPAFPRSIESRVVHYLTRASRAIRQSKPASERLHALAALDAELDSDHSDAGSFLAAISPRLSMTFTGWMKAEAYRRSLLCAIEALDARNKTGSYPRHLPDLGASSIDPFTGAKLVYWPAGYRLAIYSVGPDLDDNGGIRESSPGGPGDPRSPFDIPVIFE